MFEVIAQSVEEKTNSKPKLENKAYLLNFLFMPAFIIIKKIRLNLCFKLISLSQLLYLNYSLAFKIAHLGYIN